VLDQIFRRDVEFVIADVVEGDPDVVQEFDGRLVPVPEVVRRAATDRVARGESHGVLFILRQAVQMSGQISATAHEVLVALRVGDGGVPRNERTVVVGDAEQLHLDRALAVSRFTSWTGIGDRAGQSGRDNSGDESRTAET
jgi:hypothetical protein